METTPNMPVPKCVLVIGGGPTGLVTLRNLTERGQFEHVELYERRDNVGGVWRVIYSSFSYQSIPCGVPIRLFLTNRYFEEEDNANRNPSWLSPAYKGLIGNVLPEFLTFSGHPFPEPPMTPHQPFPTLKETYEYLRSFRNLISNQVL